MNFKKEEVYDLIREELGLEPDFEIRESMTLATDLEMDSLSKISVATEIEDHYSITLDGSVLSEVRTVDDMLKHIEEACKDKVQ